MEPWLGESARESTAIVIGLFAGFCSSQKGVQARRSREAVGKSLEARRAQGLSTAHRASGARGKALPLSVAFAAQRHMLCLLFIYAAFFSSGSNAQYASSGV